MKETLVYSGATPAVIREQARAQIVNLERECENFAPLEAANRARLRDIERLKRVIEVLDEDA